MRRKAAVVTDSNSGLSAELAQALGVFLIPMPFLIDGEIFYEGLSLPAEEFYQKMRSGAEISTSQPAVGDVLELWDRVLKEYDSLVYIPMSSGLSGSCATALTLAQEYPERVFVVNNQRISVPQLQSALDALELIEAGYSAAEVQAILEEDKFESSIYIMLDTLKYLKKGGRVTPAAAAIATVLHIRPVLQIQGEKLDAFAKARGEKNGREIMIEALRRDIDTRFGGTEQVRVFVAHTDHSAAAGEFCQQIQSRLKTEVIRCDPLSLSIACHTGPGALAIGCSRKIDRYLKK